MAPPEDERKPTRQLSAVLLADVTGYSRLMGESEVEAIAGVDALREIFTRVAVERGGSLEVSVGDCFVALFGSAVEAVTAGVDVQTRLAEAAEADPRALRVRIGIHLGEVVRTSAGLFGDSINVAARIQALAAPGGVSISEDVYRAVRSRLTLPFHDAGLHTLKNIREPVRVYEVGRVDASGSPGRSTARARAKTRGRRRTWRQAAVPALLLLALLSAVVVYLGPARAPGARGAGRGLPAVAKVDGPLVVGVMEIRARGEVPEWMRDFTRDSLNTVLSRVAALRVYSKQKIDFVREKRGLSEIEAAEALGIAKMISGTIATTDARVALEVQVVDIGSGLLEDSERLNGHKDQLVELQNQAVLRMMRALKVELSADEVKNVLVDRTNDTLESYRLLTESLGDIAAEDAPTAPRPETLGRMRWFAWPAAAHAEEPSADEAAVRTLLERYREALEAEDLQALAAIQVAMSDAQRESLARYFANAEQLKVQFTNFDILFEGDEALATFTRKDMFMDVRSGREMQLEVRMSSVLARAADGWKIRGLKKPS